MSQAIAQHEGRTAGQDGQDVHPKGKRQTQTMTITPAGRTPATKKGAQIMLTDREQTSAEAYEHVSEETGRTRAPRAIMGAAR
jgi:hypothetical protein